MPDQPSDPESIDVADPAAEELRLIGAELGFYPLAMGDVTRRLQRPKMDVYDGFC